MDGVGKRIPWVVALCLLAACARRDALVPPAPRLDVVECKLAANREYVGVRFRVTGVDSYNPETMETYLVDESTGEKFFIVRLQRIGGLAEFAAPGEKDVRSIMFWNREGKLKRGAWVTVVVGPARQEHLLLQE